MVKRKYSIVSSLQSAFKLHFTKNASFSVNSLLNWKYLFEMHCQSTICFCAV